MPFNAPLPPISNYPSPVDVHLSIRQQPGMVRAFILSSGKEIEVPLSISSEDLEQIFYSVREKIDRSGLLSHPQVHFSATRAEEILYDLARVGHYLFKSVFGDHKSVEARRVIESIVQSTPKKIIQISSNHIFLPWELLYPLDPSEDLSIHHFWGINHVISRVITEPYREGIDFSPQIEYTDKIDLGLLTLDSLDHVATQEIPFFEELQNTGRISLHKIGRLEPNEKILEMGKLRRFLGKKYQIAHFACHAIFERIQDQSTFILNEDFSISFFDLKELDFMLSGNPLIFLNACDTGTLNPLFSSSFTRLFIQRGARGVIATECLVPDQFAAAFAKYLYPRLLDGDLLGDIIIDSRQHFYEKYNNPLGLLYSMYTSPDTRLVPLEGAYVLQK